jgi:hypothetical protein
MAYDGGGDIRQQVIIDLQAIGADTASILAQAMEELQAKFRGLVQSFDDGETPAHELINGLRGIAGGLNEVRGLADSQAAAMERVAAAQAAGGDAAKLLVGALRGIEQEMAAVRQQMTAGALDIEKGGNALDRLAARSDKLQKSLLTLAETELHPDTAPLERVEAVLKMLSQAGLEYVAVLEKIRSTEATKHDRAAEAKAAATEKFIEQANAALQKHDAEEARLDAQAKARLDARAAKEKQVLDEIGAAATKAEAERARADADRAASDARKEAANHKAMADLEGWAGLQAKLGEMEKRTQEESRQAIEKTTAARQKGTNELVGEVSKLSAAYGAEGEAKRKRIDDIAREERELESLRAQLAKNALQREKEAGATAWVTRETAELTHAMQEMIRVEQAAPTFNFMTEAGRNVIGKTTEEIASLQSQMARFGQTSAVASGGLVGFVQQFNPFNKQAAQAKKGITDLSHANDDFNRSTRQASYGLLAFSYAVQDFQQSGLSAVMNNIPMMVMGIGGSAGLAGATMIAAAAFEAAAPHLTSFGRKIGLLRDPIRDAGNDLAGLKEKMQALEEKPFKVAADYSLLRELREEIKRTEKAVAEWEALKGARTKVQEESKQIIEEGVKEGGGTKNIEDAILEIKKKMGTLYMGSAHQGELEIATEGIKNNLAMAAHARKTLPGFMAEPVAAAHEARADYLKGEVARLREAMDQEARAKVGQTVSRASTSEAARQELEDYYMKNRAIFEAHGVTNRFGSAIVLGSRENVEAERENARSVKQQQEAARKVKETVTQVGPGFDEELEKSIFDAMKGGASAAEAIAAQRSALIPKLRARGIGEDVVGSVATSILKKAADAAQNLIDEGKKPKIDVAAGTAQEKEVREQVARFKPGVDEALERTMLGHIGAGATAERSMAQLLPQLRGKLLAAGVPAELAERVAQDIISKVMDKVNNKLSEAMLGGARSRRGAAAGLLDLEIAKEAAEGTRNQGTINRQVKAGEAEEYGAMFAGATGANEGQARQAGKQIAGLVEKGATVEQAMGQVFRQMNTHLQQVYRSQVQQQAMMESMAGIIGPATMLQAQLQAQQNRLGSTIRHLSNQNRRNAQNRDTLLPRQFPGMN